MLLKPVDRKQRRAAASRAKDDSWDGVDRELFESLRILRRDEAEERNVPAYIVFGDSALRDMARRRPQTIEEFREVRGVGDKKCRDFGRLFVEHIRQFTTSQ